MSCARWYVCRATRGLLWRSLGKPKTKPIQQVSTLRKKKTKKAIALLGNRGDVGAGRLVNPLGLGGQLPTVKGVVEKKQKKK